MTPASKPASSNTARAAAKLGEQVDAASGVLVPVGGTGPQPIAEPRGPAVRADATVERVIANVAEQQVIAGVAMQPAASTTTLASIRKRCARAGLDDGAADARGGDGEIERLVHREAAMIERVAQRQPTAVDPGVHGAAAGLARDFADRQPAFVEGFLEVGAEVFPGAGVG